MKVRVINRGYYGHKLREPGEILAIPDALVHKHYSHNWMEPVNPEDFKRLPPVKSERVEGSLVPVTEVRGKEILAAKIAATTAVDEDEDEFLDEENEEQAAVETKTGNDPALGEQKALGAKAKKPKKTAENSNDLNVI